MKCGPRWIVISLCVLLGTLPAMAQVVVNYPTNNSQVNSPFRLYAVASACSNQSVVAMGYSFDNSTQNWTYSGNHMDGQVAEASGPHVLHVKAWGNQGTVCDTDVSLTVVSGVVPPPTTVTGPIIPGNAIAVKAIQGLPSWKAENDAAAFGTSYGVTTLGGTATSRKFVTNYANYGGERYSANFGADTNATNFVYDGWIYLASPINDIANIEMDLNQVMANGQTVIIGFQCDGWSRSWDYTVNAGTLASPNDQWRHSNQSCNPQAWTPNAWHHVQVSYARDNVGNVLYKSVWLDNVQQNINVTAYSAFALGWGSSLVTNLQIDGMTGLPGSATVYLDNLTVYRW